MDPINNGSSSILCRSDVRFTCIVLGPILDLFMISVFMKMALSYSS